MIAAIKAGNEAAFEQAFLQHRGKVYHYFLKKTQHTDDAKDLLQTTFLKLWLYRHTLSEDYLLDQHLFRIARTVFIDHLRRAGSLKRQAAVHPFRIDSVPAPAMAFDLNYSLQTTLNSMPEIRRKVFRLHRIEGYSYYEIAQLLSISVKSVDNHLAKAVSHLKKTLSIMSFLLFYFT
jgi:RNA polymerase sigma-70 factor (ECF subfamily)